VRLEVAGVTVSFDGVRALSDVTIVAGSGERRVVIGPNGAGKTTLFNTLTGEVRPDAGVVRFEQRDVSRLGTWRRARLGVGRTFQRSTLFGELSVADNLAMAIRRRRGGQWRLWPTRMEREVTLEAERRLAASGIPDLGRSRALDLSHGQQRLVEIEMTLATAPRALLLDEPTAGLGPDERRAMLLRLRSLTGITLLIVEHDLDFVFGIAQRISVLDHGVLIADGAPDEVRADVRVQEIYLGAG
jgi:branched-chain amino acid transport system ATP-binding protein